jgi:4-hydroxybenzoate polyprenyltransferase
MDAAGRGGRVRGSDAPERQYRVLSAYLRLARLPNVFTSLADVIAGIAIARHGRFEPSDLALVGASALLYPAGMVLNDFFDRELDARERPERPIPSGQVPARTAAALGFGLLAGGIALAALAGLPSLLVAAALAAAIVIYDARAKSTPLGPPFMGLCRGLNVALGLSVAGGVHTHDLPSAGLLLPLALALYTTLLTLLARDEVHGGSTRRARTLVALLGSLGVLYVIALAASSPAGLTPPALVFYAYLLVRGAIVFGPVWTASDAMAIRRSIGGGILLMPAVDSVAVAAAGHPLAAALVLVLRVPALLLKRRFAMS